MPKEKSERVTKAFQREGKIEVKLKRVEKVRRVERKRGVKSKMTIGDEKPGMDRA